MTLEPDKVTRKKPKSEFRQSSPRAKRKDKTPREVSVNQFYASVPGDEYFFGYIFPFAGVITEANIRIDILTTRSITLMLLITQADGFVATKTFTIKEGDNPMENIRVQKGDRIKLRVNTEDEINLEIKDVFVSFILVGDTNG